MDTSSTEFLTERVLRMRMIVLVASMRVFGGSLAKMIVPVFAFLVSSQTNYNWKFAHIDCFSYTRPHEQSVPHEVVSFQCRIL
jgi:hypothetical protein